MFASWTFSAACKLRDARLLILHEKWCRSMHLLSPERFSHLWGQTNIVITAPEVFQNPHSTSEEYKTMCSFWLPSFCCSPLSGRCGKVSGVRVFAGSPCQMAVVKALGGYLVGEIAGELVSQLVRLEMMCERLSQRPGDRQNFSERSIIYQNTPLTPTPHPLAPPLTAGLKKMVQRLFFFLYEKCLKGEKAKRERGGDSESESKSHKKMEQFHRHFPRLRTVTYNHNVYTQHADCTRIDVIPQTPRKMSMSPPCCN